MPRLKPDTQTRMAHLQTKTRSVDVPVDGSGHFRRLTRGGMRVGSGPGAPIDVLETDDELETKSTTDDVLEEMGILKKSKRAMEPNDLPTDPADPAADEDPNDPADPQDDMPVPFSGRFIPFSQKQWIGSKRYGYWEINVPGCITKTIGEKNGVNNDITFNRDHDNRLLLARTANKTLRLHADEKYGYAEADMGPYSYTCDIVTGIERGDLTGMSYAFDLIDWEWQVGADGHDELYIREMELFDVAVVGMPANVDTDANLRSDILAVARSAGFDLASFDSLARRLADPDVDLIRVLRSLSSDAPVESTQKLALPEPVPSTRGSANLMVLATLASRTKLLKEGFSK